MADFYTPREWLQRRASNNGYSDQTRAQAQALLNVVGDGWDVDRRFLDQENYSSPGVTRKRDGGFFGIGAKDHGNYSNGFSTYEVNRLILPEMKRAYEADYNVWKNDPDVRKQARSNSGGYYNQPAQNTARNIALANESLSLMPNELKRIDEAERNKYANIDNDYNRSNNNLENNWKQVQEDYETARSQRLGNRRRQIDVANDDFKTQRDAYARYFARSGAGSSSMAQHTVPTMLARAAEKVRSTIEDNNAENAREQETNFNRQNLDYRNKKNDILTERERQKQSAKEYFASKRSGYWDKVAELERKKADAQNLSTDAIISAGKDAVRRAQEQADEAVRAGAVTEGIKFKPIEYEAAKQKDWTYDPTKTKIENPEEESKDDNSIYNKYFRDKEEEKKKKGWISATAA
nr:MAG TPA: hypothetical protein [Caudoviricetes sp.]